MDYYKVLRINRRLQNNKIKIFGVGLLFLLKRRYLNVFFDPIQNCNLKCLMCYYSDPGFVPEKNRIKEEDINLIARSFFPYALKLQIGCGAEPSLYTRNQAIIKLAKRYKVPYISFTTNGTILNYDKIEELAGAGLDEIIISMHGTHKEVYEKMMPGASYENLHNVLSSISQVKTLYPHFKLRINYTVNPDNIDDLVFFSEYIEKYSIDVLQIRPIRKLGNTVYSDFNLKKKQAQYTSIIDKLERKCDEFGVVSLITRKLNSDKIYRITPDIAKYTYCYLCPTYFGNEEFTPSTEEDYRMFLRKKGFFKSICKDVFLKRSRKIESHTEFGNYDVNI